jgi:dihydroorotase
MPALLIKNGRVVDPASDYDGMADVWIDDGLVKGVGPGLAAKGAQVFDATDMIVAPGFIDMHVHLREPGFEHAETIESGSRAAAAGGFTSICPMPNTSPVNDSATVTSYIVETARRHAIVNVFPIGAITKASAGEELAAIGSMMQAGAVAISDDGRPVMNARLMRRAMECALSFGLPVINHCEDLHLSAGGDMHEGLESVRLGLRGIPACSEEVMVARDILLAEVTGARYHVAHISSRHSVEMVAFAKARGLAVTAEATPHHFTLADADMRPYDSNYKMKPPLRSKADVDKVIEGVVGGAVDAIATDHAPHAGSEKMQEFEQCPFGILGLETAIGLALERLLHSGRISLAHFVRLFTMNPARILGLDRPSRHPERSSPRGTLAQGAAGDVTVFSTERDWTYDVNKSFSKSRNSPFDGKKFRGGPIATVVGGEIVWQL